MTGASERTYRTDGADLTDGGAGLFCRSFAAAAGAEAGTPIILLHATLSASVQLIGLARRLVSSGPVLAFDRRGSGQSPLPEPRRLDVAVHIADLGALLDSEGIDTAILVGHSFGAVVALEVAARLSGRVGAVVAWEPPYGPLADAPTRAQFAAVAEATERAHAGGGPAAAAATFLGGVSGAGAWQALPRRSRDFLIAQGDGAFADAALTGLEPRGLARIAAPVTVLTGTSSEPFYAPIARAVVAAIPGARLIVLDGLNHLAPIADPDAVAAVILDAIARPGITAHEESRR